MKLNLIGTITLLVIVLIFSGCKELIAFDVSRYAIAFLFTIVIAFVGIIILKKNGKD